MTTGTKTGAGFALALRYAFAGVAVAIATALRLWLMRSFGPLPTFVTLYPAVLLVASVAGGGPGLLATVLAALLADYYYLAPVGRLTVAAPNDMLALAIFTGTNLFLAVFAERLRRARQAAAVSAAQAEELLLRRRIEKELRESREWLQVTLASIGDGVITCDTAGRVTFLNPVAEALSGWKTPEAVGQPIQSVFQIINEQTREPAADIVGRVLREKVIVELANHTALVTKAGGEVSIEDSAAPIMDHAGNVVGAVLVFHDVTTQRLAREETRRLLNTIQESEERYRSLFENMLNGFAYCRMFYDEGRPQEFIYLKVNGAFETLTGLRNVVGKRVSEVIPGIRESDPELFEIYGRVASTGVPERFEKYVKALEMWFDISVYSPARGYFVAVFDVITERKRTEAALWEVNAQLREADRRKDEFLAMLAHELRNPLAPIRNAAQVLRLAGAQEGVVHRQREIIDRQVTHMAHLVDDLLDVSRITRGKIELKKTAVHLADALVHAVETVTPFVELRRHTLSLDLPAEDLRILADPDRLTQIVGNLLANAAKYTPEGGQIWLEARPEGDAALILVRDTGAGIAPEILPHIFDLFTQADQGLARAQGGLGIGLTMVKSLVELHGGEVAARSEGLGRGSEFIVRLPALPPGGDGRHPR